MFATHTDRAARELWVGIKQMPWAEVVCHAYEHGVGLVVRGFP